MTNILKAAAFSAALIGAMAILPVTAGAQDTTPLPDPTAPAQAPANTQEPQQPQEPASAQATTNPSGQTTRIAPGSIIPVELTKTVDAKKAKTGDEVVAKVTQDMKATSGEVIVAKDTKMIGHVTEAQAHTKEQKQSELGITFDKAVTKSSEMKLPMSIQAVIAPPSNNSPDGGNSAPSEPSTAGTTATSPMGGRNPAGSAAQPQPQARPTAGADEKSAGNARPPINASTQGVIGIPNLTLESNAQNTEQGSVMTSEKNNVKLESGTMLLLRVSQ